MTVHRINGKDGVILDSNTFLELPKAENKITTFPERAGMFRYNIPLKSFEGVLEFDDGSISYRRIPSLDSNGKLNTSTLPDSVVSGMRYMGTYSVIEDDIDPPLTDFQYDSLPEPTSDNSGQYYICRGIMDSAINHFINESPSTSPVIFVAENESGTGENWIEIKYYFNSDPVHPSENIVTYAFGRILVSEIPQAGHEGLISLSQNTELTNAFTSTDDPNLETALCDGDWVISNGNTQQRLRSSRTSIMASQVSFDRTISTSLGRPFKTNAGTIQTITDNIILNTIRRTGDSFYDDGMSPAAGRLALVYGTRTNPSICFTDPIIDIENDSGMDPSNWTDKSTGIYRPDQGTISFVSDTVDKFRIENTRIVVLQDGSNITNNPALQFEHFSNTNNVGISGINNSLSFSLSNKQQVKFENGLSTFYGDLTVLDNTILGTVDDNDTLQVNAISTFDASVTINAALVTTGTNYFDKDVRIKNGSGLLFVTNSGSSTGTVRLGSPSGSGLDINLSNIDYKVSVIEPGNNSRMYIGRYGVKLPVLTPINDSVGEDGTIAYSPDRQSTVQKINGSWVNIGAGSNTTIDFVKADWVNSSGYYTYTITRDRILDVRVQELVSGNYIPVEVDSTTISLTNAILRIPNTTDLRFDGRVVISQGA